MGVPLDQLISDLDLNLREISRVLVAPVVEITRGEQSIATAITDEGNETQEILRTLTEKFDELATELRNSQAAQAA